MNLQKLRETATKSCGLRLDAPVLVGVSGGPDSLCLMEGLSRLQFPVIAAHFDHRLRAESAQDAEAVRLQAAACGAVFTAGAADVAAYARSESLSLEEAARVLRYRFLFHEALRFNAQAVAVGHTADDQVETILMHLLQGSGLNGLAGMAYRSFPGWDSRIPLVRPLLDFRREEIETYCAEHGLQPLRDTTNQDTTFTRNRIRHELIPLLETYNPRIRQALLNTARSIEGDLPVIEASVLQAWQACLAEKGEGYAVLHLPVLQGLLTGLQRRVLRRAARLLLPDLRNVDFSGVERGMGLLIAHKGRTADLGGGLSAWVEGDLLLIAREGAELPQFWPQIDCSQGPLPVAVPGDMDLPGGWLLTSLRVNREEVDPRLADPWQVMLDEDNLHGVLILRCPVPGDRFQPLGMESGSAKLADFWVNNKLPRRARERWPVLLAGEAVAWVPGFRPAHPFRVTENTRRVLHLRLSRV